MQISAAQLRGRLKKQVQEISGEELAACNQCGKCSACCPLVSEMDLLPNQVIRLVTSLHVHCRLSRTILSSARRNGAQAIAAACPLCQFNLDEARRNGAGGLPVLYFIQLMAVALDLQQ